ncbi:uncharacterized protein RJT20DRAFT_124553 [Scheffersomyces xylosifermentans]|uniref:uncharacterized protein n=1 Tax=Scheffersomyces xylosifermentans TaxID=1304137 RepID=UPI00315D0818
MLSAKQVFTRTISSSLKTAKGQKRYVSKLLTRNPDSITVEDIKSSSLKNDEGTKEETDGRVSLIKAVNSSNNAAKQDLLNELIPNFSLYFRLAPRGEDIDNHIINSKEILGRLIEVNPGRVLQSWELFKTFEDRIQEVDHLLVNRVLEKLLNGEKVDSTVEGEEQDENAKFKIPLENLEKVHYLLTKYIQQNGNVDYVIYQETLVRLIDRLIEDELVVFVDLLLHNDFLSLEFLKNYFGERSLNTESANYTYLSIFKKIFETSPEMLTKEDLVSCLDLITDAKGIDEINSKQAKLSTELNEAISVGYEFTPVVPSRLQDEILRYIESSNLDLDKSPESLLLRLKVIEIYGMEKDDIDTALKQYHSYQTHDKFGIELVQTKLLQAFAYQAINQDNETFVTVAETLQPTESEGLPIKVLQILMIAHSNFESEKSLDYYNDYIQRVSKDLNEHTKRSPTGLLTESLILSLLFDNDRNFASLVFEMAIEKGVISDELEISHIKKLFRVYGDSFVGQDEEWEHARKNLKKYVLNYVRNL